MSYFLQQRIDPGVNLDSGEDSDSDAPNNVSHSFFAATQLSFAQSS